MKQSQILDGRPYTGAQEKVNMIQRKSTHPDPIDVYVGQRVRLRRMMLGMSQEKLGEAIGVAFQQLQKYEKGRNRISASRLLGIARELNVPIDFFFEEPRHTKRLDNRSPQPVIDFLSTAEGLALNKHFIQINDPATKRQLVGLVKQIANMQGR